MFSRFCTKAVLCLIVVTLTLPSGLLLYPKKAEAAGNDCLIRIGATLGINKVLGKLTGKVPIAETSGVQAGVAGSFVQDCVINPLVTQLAKAMLYNITVSTVEWINSGFKGNPGFIKDFRGLMLDTADQVIGEFLEKEAAFLCSPFAFQVRIQLAQTYLPYRQRAACTLTQAIQNVEGFADNNNGYGWDQWLEVTTVPQNNQYGAFVIAQDELSKKIIDAQYVKETYANWGNGFKDWEYCEKDADGFETCNIGTPGTIVESLLKKTFVDAPIDQLGVADNLNAIFDALANQFTKMIVNGATGILGGKKSPNENLSGGGGWGSVNYDGALRANNNDPSLSAAIDQNLGETGASLAPFFTEPEPIDVESAPATASDTEEPTEPGPPEIGLTEISSTPAVTSTVPFSYEMHLVSNYYESGLSVKMTLKKNGVAIALSDIFAAPEQITYGRSDVGYETKSYPFPEHDPNVSGVSWANIAVHEKGKYVFKFLGYKKGGAAAGEYVIETLVTDKTGAKVDMKESKFTVQ